MTCIYLYFSKSHQLSTFRKIRSNTNFNYASAIIIIRYTKMIHFRSFNRKSIFYMEEYDVFVTC